MSKTIVKKIIFKNTSPKVLFELYMDEIKHSKVTGSPAKIQFKEGSNFSTYDGYISGKNIHLVKDKLIVQTWRGTDWEKEEPDSIFIIKLQNKNKDVVLHAVHANVPKKQFESIKKGWHKKYWELWKKHLTSLAKEKKKQTNTRETAGKPIHKIAKK